MKKNLNKIIVGTIFFIFALGLIISQGGIRSIGKQTFAISSINLNPLNDGKLYYGCKSPISIENCVYYGEVYYSQKYENIKNVGCREKEWGIECTFNGEKI